MHPSPRADTLKSSLPSVRVNMPSSVGDAMTDFKFCQAEKLNRAETLSAAGAGTRRPGTTAVPPA
jgi:hypothetical protein